jgi:amino acid adenylation domain-containing protein
MYGITETTVHVTYRRVTAADVEQASGSLVGGALPDLELFVLDARLRMVPVGVPGEIYVGGAGLARGYLHRPALTAERFVPHPFSAEAGARLYKTGDRARYLSNGDLEYLGRVDQQVKVRGFRIELGEIEAALAQHDAVCEALVLPEEGEAGGHRLVAYLVCQAGRIPTTSELRAHLRKKLPEHMIPAAFVTLDSFPLTAHGKVDRRALAALEVHAADGGRPYAPPRTGVEETLCDIWAEVLRAERVGIHDNFFDLGGDSILTLQVLVKAREAGLDLTVQQLFQHQTICELAQGLRPSDEAPATVVRTQPFGLVGAEDRPRLPADVVDAYPLTSLQTGMLFHSELNLDSAVYHDIFSFHLRTPLDIDALRAALRQLADRHPVLRTSFNLSDFGEPLQLVHRAADVPLEDEDLRRLSHAEQEEALAGWMAAEKRYRFDWRKAPLLRLHVHRRTEESFQLSLSFHHAILDGWSVAALLTELFQRHRALAGAEAAAAEPPLAASFSDFVAAEREASASEGARQYWVGRLGGVTPSSLPRWPAELLAPGEPEARMLQVEIPAKVSDALKELALMAGAPVKSVLLAAHLRALSFITGRDDVLTGLVSHGRPETSDGESVLGLFLNTLPLSQRMSGGTWVELVQETFRAERELLPFRRYPMARLQRELGNDAPLFEVAFNFVHFHVYNRLHEAGGVEVLGARGFEETNFTLTANFHLDLSTSRVRLDLNYDASVLPDRQVEAIGRCYAAVLEAMTSHPSQRYEYECPLPAEERRQVFFRWNATATDYPHDKCIQRLFEEQAERSPDATAIVSGARTLTYREVNRRANVLARRLREHGVGPDVFVGLCAERSPEMVMAMLGILKAGGAYVPLDVNYPPERLRFMLQEVEAPVLLTQQQFLPSLPSDAARVFLLDADGHELDAAGDENVAADTTPDNLAYVIYTSGSTGTPKGVGVPHRAIARLVRETDYVRLTPADRVAQVSNPSFDAITFEVWGALLNGGQLVILPGDVTLSPSDFAAQLREQKVTALFLTTALFNHVARAEPRAFGSLRYVLLGGEAVAPKWVREVLLRGKPEHLLNVYGPTENTTFSTWHEVREVSPEATTVPIGRPIANTQAYVLDVRGQAVPPGTPGELYLGGPGLARGYLRRPGLTAEKFVPHPFGREGGERLYRTGDLVSQLPDGDIEFIGRVDHQVKVRGFRIELGEVEAVLKRHEGVKDAVVLVREDGEAGEKRLVAYVTTEPERTPTAGDLRYHLREHLPEYMLPSTFMMLDVLPLTRNGKVDRGALPAPEEERPELEQVYVAPRTPVEEMLAGLWESVLRVRRVGAHDNFFELGGHSLLATQLISRVRNAFALEIPLRRLFDEPTVAGLAQVIEAEMRAGQETPELPLLPAPRGDALPLSYAQQRLWFLNQLMPESTAYHLPIALRLRGPLNVAALEQSLNGVIRRHEAMRTVFAVTGGEPEQIINPFQYAPLSLVDLSSLPERERAARVARLAVEEAGRIFDLQRGPLTRIRLLRLGEGEHVLLLTMHHIVSDGWSMEVLTREALSLYSAFSAGLPSPLEELPVQYADYAAWQRRWLDGEVLERQLSYWRDRLDRAPALELPTDHHRPPVQGFRGATLSTWLGPALCERLKTLARSEGATMFMALLAGLQALLSRYTGQEDICVGTAVANRRRAEVEGLVGFFVNTLVLRTDLSGDPTFRQLLRRVREVCLGAYAHQDVPFEALVERLRVERDLSRNPLFQVMFVMGDERWGASWDEDGGLRVSEVGGDSGAIFDLTLWASEHGGRVRLSLQYSTELFEARTARLLLGHLGRLLRGASESPDAEMGALELLGRGERRRLLAGWNRTARAYSRGQCLHHLFEEQARQTPKAGAVVFEGEQLSYAELNRRADRLARRLRSLGVGPDERVGVMLRRTPELVVALLGVLKAGGAYVPLDPAYPRARLSLMAGDAGLRLIVTEAGLLGSVPDEAGAVLLIEDVEGQATPAKEAGGHSNPPEVTESNLAYVIYTSGSTGRPKGVAIEHRSAVVLMHWARETFGAEALGGVLASTSICFDLSVFELFAPLCWGGTVILAEDALRLPELAAAGRVRLINTVPSAMSGLLRAGGLPPGVRVVNLAGEPLSAKLAREVYAAGAVEEVNNLYGPTEDTTYSTHWPAVRDGEVRIGRPVSNTRVYVVDDRGRPVPTGVAGELLIGGEGLARGYLNRPGLTAERFVPDPFGEPGARLYRTGDLVRWTADGELEYLGRADQQVKVRGFRIEPGEIEETLRQHPAVREAVVLAREVATGDRRLVAYVASEPGAAGDSGEWRRHLEERLPSYMIPSVFAAVEEFPLTPNGKIDRRALPAPDALESEREGAYVAPRTPTEEVLTGLWESVLRVRRVGAHDNFFELGGHSLLATQLVSRVREVFVREIALRQVFETPTPAGLAEVIEMRMRGGEESAAPRLLPVPRDKALPVSFSQRRLWFLDQLEPGNTAYNIPFAARLKGALSVTALEQTLGEVVRRHEALRTTFRTQDGQPLQVIHAAAPVSLSLADLSGLDEAGREAQAQSLAAAEARLPFDLARGPLLRLLLLRLGSEEHVLLLTMHHIISDAWSIGVLMTEMTTLYETYRGGRPSTLPELKIQYPDYAAWQREYLEGDLLEKQVGYWKRQLAGAPQLLNLPTDRPRPAVQGYRGGQEISMLPPETAEALHDLGRGEDATLFMVLLAAFQTLLSWYSRQDDIVVASPVAGRGRAEVEGLIGFFINTLVLRTDLSGDPSFRQLLRRVREVCLGAYAHQDVPFEALVEAVAPERSLSHTPLSQVVIGLLNVPPPPFKKQSLTVEEFPRPIEVTHSDLELSVMNSERGLLATLTYNLGLFEAVTVRRMLKLLKSLLAHVAAHPEATTSELSAVLDRADSRERAAEEAEFKDAALRQLKSAKRRTVGREIPRQAPSN